MTVRFTAQAATRLAEIVAVLRAENPVALKRLAQQLARAKRRLITFPRSSPGVPEFPWSPLREFFIPPHRFFYFVDDGTKTIWILEIWHGAQLPDEPRLPLP